jgi:hypothetical protein
MVLPTGIVTADTTQDFVADLVRSGGLASIFDFDNRGGIFSEVQGNVRFCLLTMTSTPQPTIRAAAQLRSSGELQDATRQWSLTRVDIARINPNTLTLPLFPSPQEAVIVRHLYRVARCFDEIGAEYAGHWVAPMQRMLHMGDDSHLFKTDEQLQEDQFKRAGNAWTDGTRRYIPLLEAKLCHQFYHRAGTFDGIPRAERFGTHPATREMTIAEHVDPTSHTEPRYWVPELDIRERIKDRRYLLAFRDAVSAVADSRSLVSTIVPPHGAGHTLNFCFPRSATDAAYLCAWFNAFSTDFVFRVKASGGHASFFLLRQLPIPDRNIVIRESAWDRTTTAMGWMIPRVIELTYSAWDLQPFALECGWSRPPFRWDFERRFLLRCELDAAFFHLYLPAEANGDWRAAEGETAEDLVRVKAIFPTPRDAVAYIMDTFSIVKRKDEENFSGHYRTKRVVLEIYDAMAEAMRTGTSYQTRLDPPAADPDCCHLIGILAFGSLIQDPGMELEARIVMRIKTLTPFPVEYARTSGKTRGGAPTLVPHGGGSSVSAEIFVLDDDIPVSEARDMLWRRETRKTAGEKYAAEGASANSVLVREIDTPWVSTVLYTDFSAAGKMDNPTAEELARRAIQSVAKADEGQDGISYLMNAITCGIETPLTPAYRDEILKQTETKSLQEALTMAKVKIACKSGFETE